MRLPITFLLVFGYIKCYCCFNLDTNFPFVYEDPSKFLSPNANKSSYFGYSIVLYPGNRRNVAWILTGAPRGYDTTKHSDSGLCFRCGIGKTCQKYDVVGLSQPGNHYEEKTDQSWLGGSMDINYSLERIVACAPRWIKIKRSTDNKNNDYHMQGACYWLHINDNSSQKLLPFLDRPDVYQNPSGKSSVYYFAQGQAGFSVHMPSHKKEIVMGAPGVFNWGGTPVLYRDGEESDPIVASRLHRNRIQRRDADVIEFGYKKIADVVHSSQTVAYDLMGYSTTSGRFYKRSELLYVSAAPRSDYLGLVLIYDFDFDNNADKPVVVKESKYGKQFGEYFGGSLTAGDVNGDGLDDLIVGAPFHMSTKYNEGKVYIFLGSKNKRLQPGKEDSIVGTSTNGQFGTALQYLGDINHDGFGDVAVAAPYEDDQGGVVYLFRGTSRGLERKHSQRIVGKNIYQSIRGFGISISRAADMDYNGYGDIAIGAYLSGHVVLLRSRPAVTIYQDLESLVPHLEFKTVSFTVRACFWYKLDQLDAGNIIIERTLTIDQQLGRANLPEGEYTKLINLMANQRICENITIGLLGSYSNRYDPITVSLAHKFQANPETKETIYVASSVKGTDMFRPRSPVYNEYDSKSLTTREIPFALGCKSGNICKASLEFTPEIIDIGEDNNFVLGSKNYVTLRTTVKNLGEKAYLSQLVVTLPEIVTFQSTPSACTEKNASSVVCSVDNPLETNSQKIVNLNLDMTLVNSGKYEQSLVFTVEVVTSSENDGDKIKELILKLTREADVTITGKSEEQSYSYGNITQGKPSFSQIYQVEKFQRSLLNEITVEVNIPHAFNMDDGSTINFLSLFPPSGTLAGQKVTCSSNFSYIIQNQEVNQGDLLSDIIEDEESLKRPVRQVEVFNNKSTTIRQRLTQADDFEAFQNRTYHINCSMDQVVCSKVVCTAGPIKSGQLVKIKLKMMFDIAALQDLLGKKDVVLLATQGRVMVTNPRNFMQSGSRPDTADAVALFVGDTQSEKVALWIIIVSVIAGLLLLLLLILGLIKAGFFKRTTKDELEQLKKEMECNPGESNLDAIDQETQE